SRRQARLRLLQSDAADQRLREDSRVPDAPSAPRRVEAAVDDASPAAGMVKRWLSRAAIVVAILAAFTLAFAVTPPRGPRSLRGVGSEWGRGGGGGLVVGPADSRAEQSRAGGTVDR